MGDGLTWVGDDETEITIRRGVMFKDGTVAVSVYDKLGTGATGYVTPEKAKEVGEELVALAAPPAATEPMVAVPLELLIALVKDDDCLFDHSGNCQEHGYYSLIPGQKCPQADLKERLAAEGWPGTEGMEGR